MVSSERTEPVVRRRRGGGRRAGPPVMLTAVALAAVVALHPHRLQSRSEQAAAGEAVVTYPGPGWRFASPRTTITIRGIGAASLAGLRVTGSVSGEHAGRLHALRLGSGAVFRPDAPFRSGERVTVRLPDAAGDDARAFSFTIARLGRYAASDDDPGNPAKRAPPTRARRAGQGCRLRSQRYVTRPRLRPTAFCVTRTAGSKPRAGYILLTPRPGARERLGEQHGAMLVSDAGRVLWYSRRPAKTHDLKVVEIGGRPLLALFQQTAKGGAYVLLDSRYREVRRIGAGNGYPVNSHELQVTPRETAYVSAYARVRVGASGRLVTDFVVQELDLVTGDVLFEWHALDHVSTAASFASRPAGGRSWDYFHGNAIEPPAPGARTLLVSARNTSAVYGIDRVTGSVRWILGGKADQFGLAARHPTWRFCAQHDARWMPNGDIMVFDNGGKALTEGAPLCPVHPARVERFAVDVPRRTARLVRVVSSRRVAGDGRGRFPSAVGSARRGPNGELLISWGTSGLVTEVAPDGRVTLRLQLAVWTYRAVRARWTGRPGGLPAVVARDRGAGVDVWASWNGATEIRRWQVLGGASPATLRPACPPRRFAGLETRMRIRGAPRYVAVEALDRTGAVLGRSRAVPVLGAHVPAGEIRQGH